ncbi:hypothetical protein C8R42DRAFT_56363 [Lentinula raphanica]|nr:hypothetical protein C8R42DRAFT_56363 [Lentinula raphanica]
MSSIANSSARHVRFGDELPKPPSDRYRVDGVVYPRVAQIKGEAHTHDSFDLHWKYECLSVASRVETVGTMEVKEDERKFTNPRLASSILPARLAQHLHNGLAK